MVSLCKESRSSTSGHYQLVLSKPVRRLPTGQYKENPNSCENTLAWSLEQLLHLATTLTPYQPKTCRSWEDGLRTAKTSPITRTSFFSTKMWSGPRGSGPPGSICHLLHCAQGAVLAHHTPGSPHTCHSKAFHKYFSVFQPHVPIQENHPFPKHFSLWIVNGSSRVPWLALFFKTIYELQLWLFILNPHSPNSFVKHEKHLF